MSENKLFVIVIVIVNTYGVFGGVAGVAYSTLDLITEAV